ncbi:spermine synthase [Raphidocelis subcapitata]|uniref:thermospermine synthase n=1 Tax=Raphidocelis subcapitata TaxID=307507 RepID=A0A2V0NJP5_9CHLO|nr:spermine synthase [Raphidocelis subcapitata]|eukprot:GBF87456.1 spermine synthase [Raphidocelis subcapitata]
MSEEYTKRLWLEEDLADDLKWSMMVKNVMFSGKSKFQEVDLIHTGPFGKTLFLDGKVQSSEVDEWVYHELLVHPAMVMHPNPKSVFICGGGEGATAREVLRHKSVEKLVMVDIDKVVCDFCHEHLEVNKSAFESPRLELINDDARAQLEAYPGKFDVIIGDLADPLEGGPCYQLYTQDFYQNVVLKKLNPGGIFITQSGPAGILSCTEVFTAINCTLRSVFPRVLPYTQHMPVYCDVWGWNMALTDPKQAEISPEEMDRRLAARVEGEMRFLDGATFEGLRALNKHLRGCLAGETCIYTADTARFIHGSVAAGNKAGTGANGSS